MELSHNFASEWGFSSASSDFEVRARLHKPHKSKDVLHYDKRFHFLIESFIPNSRSDLLQQSILHGGRQTKLPTNHSH